MAAAPAEFHRALDRLWQGVADRFDVGSTIVDLACGTGAAGNRLIARRPDLSVIGVDFAEIGTGATDSAIEVRPRIAIEQLPFADASLDGAISQFGFEYCDVRKGTVEVARVLKRGAKLCLLVHHAHSPILLDNVRSDRALRALLSPPMKRAFLSRDEAMVRAILAALPAAARLDPTIDLLSSTLIDRLAWPKDQRARSWDAIADAMRPEIALAAALDRSAVRPSHIAQWLKPLAADFVQISAKPLDIGGQTMAWTVEAKRGR